MDIGKKIKILRAEKGISQQELARLINRTRSLISRIEVTSKANYYTLRAISDVLDVSIDYFIAEINTDVLNESTTEYSSLSDRITKVERENELLNEIISNQKEIILQLKDRLKKAKK
jgi:transcriptional regulator with XRE-family HTH domain